MNNSAIETLSLKKNLTRLTNTHTSMATPHVAGVAALLMAAKLSAPTPEIIAALRETAKHPLGESLRPDNRWGYGLIQPAEALQVL